ncbi:uncharacterized protein PO1_contig-002-36 [Mycobacterium sp. PO1]|nr:uncharacterized protein PO1_contig-002-36 [Mycobacterium sp. PO1]GFM26356.1 uncharacterized protein PO2_contig-093-25 [Mycobacterium sp. PO2]
MAPENDPGPASALSVDINGPCNSGAGAAGIGASMAAGLADAIPDPTAIEVTPTAAAPASTVAAAPAVRLFTRLFRVTVVLPFGRSIIRG